MKRTWILVSALFASACATVQTENSMNQENTPHIIAEGSNKAFRHQIKSEASRELIWELWTHPDKWSQWDLGLKAARLDNNRFDDGSTGVIISLDGRESRFEVIEYVEGQSYAFVTSLPLAKLVVRRSFVDEISSDIIHEVRFEGLLAGLWASRFGSDFRKLLPPTMERLVKIASSE